MACCCELKQKHRAHGHTYAYVPVQIYPIYLRKKSVSQGAIAPQQEESPRRAKGSVVLLVAPNLHGHHNTFLFCFQELFTTREEHLTIKDPCRLFVSLDMPKRKHASLREGHAKNEQEEEEQPPSNGGSEEEKPLSSTEDDSDDAFDSGDDDNDDSEDDADGAAFDSIDVDFEFFDPVEGDFHGLKSLLNNFLDGKPYACSDLVEAVIASPVGSVIKCGEGEDLIGIATVLPMKQHTDLKALDDIKAFLEDNCPTDMADKLAAAWTAPGTALLLSERLLNCPPQLAPPLMESLFKEASETLSQKPSQYHFVMRAYSDPLKPSELIFATPEGEFLTNRALWTFSFTVSNRPVGKNDLAPRRVVAAVPAKAVPAVLRELTTAIPL